LGEIVACRSLIRLFAELQQYLLEASVAADQKKRRVGYFLGATVDGIVKRASVNDTVGRQASEKGWEGSRLAHSVPGAYPPRLRPTPQHPLFGCTFLAILYAGDTCSNFGALCTLLWKEMAIFITAASCSRRLEENIPLAGTTTS
jgi:hypothetical protein